MLSRISISKSELKQFLEVWPVPGHHSHLFMHHYYCTTVKCEILIKFLLEILFQVSGYLLSIAIIQKKSIIFVTKVQLNWKNNYFEDCTLESALILLGIALHLCSINIDMIKHALQIF